VDLKRCERFLVFGMARSGAAVAQLLGDRGYRVYVYDENSEALSRFAKSNIAGNENIEVLDAGAVGERITGVDCMIVSPGIALSHPHVACAFQNSVPVVGEVEVAYQFSDQTIIGVTGTNGKSTTVRMVGDIFGAAGIKADVAGNIGYPLAEAVSSGRAEVLIVELSSFQLDTIDRFRCDIAALLNVTPDHLDRYENSFEKYRASKARILNRADSRSTFVYNADDQAGRDLALVFPGTSLSFSSSMPVAPGACLGKNKIIWCEDGTTLDVLALEKFGPVGVHNIENAMAAACIARSYGIDFAVVRRALESYRPLPHRMEMVRVRNGVAYIDDSKATNVDAALKSLRSIDGPVIMILGGRDKDSDFSAIGDQAARIRSAVLIGEATGKIKASLAGRCEISTAASMSEAVRMSADAACAGDTVLLAPACASFDMFSGYEERGNVFQECVNALD